jgi:hypothetical protein
VGLGSHRVSGHTSRGTRTRSLTLIELPSGVANDDFCYITSTGRVTGDQHTIEIWFALWDTTVYVLNGSGEESDTVRNLRADPRATVRLRERTFDASARLDLDADEDHVARTLVFEKYQPRNRGGLEGWRETALPVAFDLLAPGQS